MSNKFGYPICCDTWFTARIQRKVVFELTYLQKKYAKYGFIPCPKCAEKLDTENMRLDQLIQQKYRTVDYVFPMCCPRNHDEIEKMNQLYNKCTNTNTQLPKKEH